MKVDTYSIKCPACGALPGKRCYGNGKMLVPHSVRGDAARDQHVIDLRAKLERVTAERDKWESSARGIAEEKGALLQRLINLTSALETTRERLRSVQAWTEEKIGVERANPYGANDFARGYRCAQETLKRSGILGIEDGEINLVDAVDVEWNLEWLCPKCKGYGSEICNNPDHEDGVDFGSKGCPVCAHDPQHRIPNSVCIDCNGTGIRRTQGSHDE